MSKNDLGIDFSSAVERIKGEMQGSPEGKFLLGVVGDSMAPTVNNGDTVMLDTLATHIFDGNIYALRMDSTIMIKRLALLPDDKVRLISDNKTEYDPIDANRKDSTSSAASSGTPEP